MSDHPANRLIDALVVIALAVLLAILATSCTPKTPFTTAIDGPPYGTMARDCYELRGVLGSDGECSKRIMEDSDG